MKVVPSILLVDDELADLALCERTLRISGRFEYVMRARTGVEALAMFTDEEASQRAHPERFPPALVLLDINMPRMNGFELLEALAGTPRAVPPLGGPLPPIVMLSSSGAQDDRARCLEYSCVVQYLVKPLRAQDAIGLAERFGREPRG